MMWRPMRPLDAYLLRPLGVFGKCWQFLAQYLAARPEGKYVLDTLHGPVVVIWVTQTEEGPFISGLVDEKARRFPRRTRLEVRRWLDENARGGYTVPEERLPVYERFLSFIGFVREGDKWRWPS